MEMDSVQDEREMVARIVCAHAFVALGFSRHDAEKQGPTSFDYACADRVLAALRSAPVVGEQQERKRTCEKCSGRNLYVRWVKERERQEHERGDRTWDEFTVVCRSAPCDREWLAEGLAIICRTCQYRWFEPVAESPTTDSAEQEQTNG
jgi:hypothetical protein